MSQPGASKHLRVLRGQSRWVGGLEVDVVLCDPSTLDDAQLADVREAAMSLRRRYAALRVVVVDAFDMRHEPAAATGTRHQLWWGASDGHCWSVTADGARASGLFIAAAVVFTLLVGILPGWLLDAADVTVTFGR